MGPTGGGGFPPQLMAAMAAAHGAPPGVPAGGPPPGPPGPPQGGGGDARAAVGFLRQALAALRNYEQAEPDPEDKAVAAKVYGLLVQLMAKDQKERDAALGTTPAHKAMRNSAGGPGGV